MFLLLLVLFYAVFLVSNQALINDGNRQFVRETFFLSLKYDLLIAGYIIALPFLLSSVLFLFKIQGPVLFRISSWYYALVSVPVILLCTANIPFFNFFKISITRSIHFWMTDPAGMLGFILNEKSYWPYLLGFVLFSGLFFFSIREITGRIGSTSDLFPGFTRRIAIWTVSCFLLFLSMKGGNIQRTIMVKDAFISNDHFINQLSINPVLSYINSVALFRIDYLPESKAFEIASSELGATVSGSGSPIARWENANAKPRQLNVVVVLMESMLARASKLGGNMQDLTPNLDTLASKGIWFTNAYSSGIHTCNGVYSSLFGLPSLMAEHPMANNQATGQSFNGIPETLKQAGYTTSFFCSHEKEFDNLGYFLPKNGIDSFYDKYSFPAWQRSGPWGVSDEYLLDFALNKFDMYSKKSQPFLGVIQTISTHEPAKLPANTKYQSRFKEDFAQAYDYADHCIGRFMTEAAKKTWFDSTLFVFVGDHGRPYQPDYQAPLSFNHVMMLINGPVKQQKIESPALQIDLFSTVMGILNLQILNGGTGVNLLKQARKYAYFSQDDKLMVVSDSLLYLRQKDGTEQVFRYRNQRRENVLVQFRSEANQMRDYAFAMLQTTQWALENRMLGFNAP